MYADWNNDGDFNDADEFAAFNTGTVPAVSSSTTGTSIRPPLNITPGNYRVRMTLSENGAGSATACGTYKGEVEDYIITIAANTAPVLNTSATTFMNTLLSTNTNSNGISLTEFIQSSQPASALMTDANDNGSGNFYNLVPRRIAVYAQSASNGTWQYKVGFGAWTDFGSVTSSNALLLMADAGSSSYQPATRIRFVPTSAGTPTFTYRAWMEQAV